jgi:hypothetical protein
MGMFTTVIHDGEELQFKHGWDDCCVYKVGDTIGWKPDPMYPGSHIDGVHHALGDDGARWVIVKNCTIVAVELFMGNDEARLKVKYGITDPDPKLWTEEQWQAMRDREARYKAEYEAWAKIHGDDPVAYYMHKRFSEKAFIDQILPARKAD